MNILLISDNKFLIEAFNNLVQRKGLSGQHSFHYVCSPVNKSLLADTSLPVPLGSIDMKNDYRELIGKYELIFSLHCKQLFPAELVNKVRCINVHPGLNPYNRGWFPQVFSILNGKKAGATIHEIDEELDHGAVIVQKGITIEAHDTSLTAYEKIQQAEVELLDEHLEAIIANTYQSFLPAEEGNVNLKKDFNALCKIDLDKQVTMKEAIDYLRAMTHGDYANAWFTDANGKKVYVKITLQ
ncbi:MAG: dTDP-4-amino-4,6-dideoxyglucose formyltransferase [Chitinophagales bacterium]|nr:dTDP-4-amino-4,6-dideoxyglucose formyltransferase [Chitinophagales bacterium]